MLIICPFNRPAQLGRLLSFWKAQTVPCRLVLAAKERSWWAPAAEAVGAVVLDGHKTVGAAKNAALEYARANGETWATVWDDDDYYGPRYIEQALEHVSPDVDVLTQGIGFVRFDDGLYLFEKPIHFCPGHCTTLRVNAVPNFLEVSLGEDVAWSKLLDWKRVRQIPPWHSVYYRTTGGHAFDATQDEFMKQFEPLRKMESVPDTFVDSPCDISEYPYFSVTDEAVFRALERRLFRPRSMARG